MIIYGINAVREALRSGMGLKKVFVADRMDSRIREIVDTAGRKGLSVIRKDRDFFRQGSRGPTQYVAADIDFSFAPIDKVLALREEGQGLVLVLDLVEDPRNLGAVIRSAAACGIDGVVIQSRRSCGITSAVFQASAGAIAHVRISEVPNIKNALRLFRDEGYTIVGADASGEALYWQADYTRPTVIVMGSEGRGMRQTVKALCDMVVRIPMKGKVGSLNVSVAAGIILYDALRQKMMKP